jgi:hypothetical protein
MAHGLTPVGRDLWRSAGGPWLAWLRQLVMTLEEAVGGAASGDGAGKGQE